MADVLVIVPTYNEVGNLAGVLGRLRQAVPTADVLVVDDASPDGTGALADSLAANDPGLSVWHRRVKEGLGRAYVDSFRKGIAAGYLFLVEMDADGSHDPAELPAMLAAAASGADLVLGSRWVPGGAVRNWPWLRQAISRVGNSYARVVLGSARARPHVGFPGVPGRGAAVTGPRHGVVPGLLLPGGTGLAAGASGRADSRASDHVRRTHRRALENARGNRRRSVAARHGLGTDEAAPARAAPEQARQIQD